MEVCEGSELSFPLALTLILNEVSLECKIQCFYYTFGRINHLNATLSAPKRSKKWPRRAETPTSWPLSNHGEEILGRAGAQERQRATQLPVLYLIDGGARFLWHLGAGRRLFFPMPTGRGQKMATLEPLNLLHRAQNTA